jgi:hypothetical protein
MSGQRTEQGLSIIPQTYDASLSASAPPGVCGSGPCAHLPERAELVPLCCTLDAQTYPCYDEAL